VALTKGADKRKSLRVKLNRQSLYQGPTALVREMLVQRAYRAQNPQFLKFSSLFMKSINCRY